MFTKEINGRIYSFKFGIGFVHDIDKQVIIKGEDGQQNKRGLVYALAGIMDQDPDKFIDCLLIGNKYSSDETKLTRDQIVEWMESDEFDFEQECKELMDFFENANFTKRKVKDLQEWIGKSQQIEDARFKAQLSAGMN